MFGESYAPDGIEETQIDVLLAEASAEWREVPRPTSALLDGTALARRKRRETQRLLGATVRVLRTHGPLSVPTGTEAA